MPRQTTFLKPNETNAKWHHVDAQGKVLGRIASDIAVVLMGKHRPTYTPHVDTGDYVVVTNARGLVLTGRKGEQKFARAWSGYPGGLKLTPYSEVLAKKPEQLLRDAVRRMLPKNRLGRDMLSKLKIYRDADHPHHAQRPESLACTHAAD